MWSGRKKQGPVAEKCCYDLLFLMKYFWGVVDTMAASFHYKLMFYFETIL